MLFSRVAMGIAWKTDHSSSRLSSACAIASAARTSAYNGRDIDVRMSRPKNRASAEGCGASSCARKKVVRTSCAATRFVIDARKPDPPAPASSVCVIPFWFLSVRGPDAIPQRR